MLVDVDPKAILLTGMEVERSVGGEAEKQTDQTKWQVQQDFRRSTST